MTLFKDRYRAESSRLKGWDYSAVGYYFVTICTRNRECWLGEVANGIMRLSSVGEIIAAEWQKTSSLRENVTLDEWVVMPNHIHGIVCINNPAPVETHCNASPQSHCNVP
jgi:putative transposase